MMTLAVVAVAVLAAPTLAHADMTFKITGGGFGHGIGLSQYGAKGYAEAGWGYADILRWYYGADRDGSTAGVKVATLASVGKYANPLVKVHLDDGDDPRTSWTLRGWKSRLRLVDDDGTVAFLSADDYHTFTISGSRVAVGGKTYTGTLIVRPETTAGVSTPLIVVRDGSGGYNTSRVRYRGEVRLSLYDGRLRAINVLPMESYLKGVVPRESISSWHMEALKAQAVAARSYAWASAPPSVSTSNTLSSILHCTTYSQMYCGHSHLNSDDSVSLSLKETERTNQAVDDTTGRVVYHTPTSRVVTTYFSSSSGGHTADIEDVWLTSTPQPYYKGVVDRDDAGNPYHAWDAVEKTGAQLAAALRARDDDNGVLDYTAPSPATVTSISHDKASSGFVRYVTVRFSNGSSYRIPGSTVRSALSLKSTKFTIAPINVWYTFQQSDVRGAYAGSWTTYKNSSLLGGSYKYASKNTGLAIYTFKGTGFKWVTSKLSSGGYGDVYLDGVKQSRVSLYSASPVYRSTAWSKTGLSADATHTVIIHVTGLRPSGSRGTNVGVDAVQVMNGSLRTATKPSFPSLFDQTDSRISYTGLWTTYTYPSLFGGTYQWARTTEDSATFAFIGTRARIVTMLNTTHGTASIYLDGRAPVTASATGTALTYRQPVWDSGVLPFGRHTVRVVPKGTGPFGLDRVDVWAGQLAP